MDVEDHSEALRRRHIQRGVFAAFGEPALAGGDQRAWKEASIGETLAEVGRHRRGLARLRQDGKDGVGVLARDVKAAVVAELHVEGMDHRRNVLGGHHHIGEAGSVTAAMVAGDMAVLAPGAGNVEIVADLREAAGNVQRSGVWRRVEEQGMLLAGRAVILEDADDVDAGLALTSVTDQPHDFLPPRLSGYAAAESERCTLRLSRNRAFHRRLS